MKYRVFTRTWWRNNPDYLDTLEPCPGRKTIIGKVNTEEEARLLCKNYNDNNDPGRLSRMAEYECI